MGNVSTEKSRSGNEQRRIIAVGALSSRVFREQDQEEYGNARFQACDAEIQSAVSYCESITLKAQISPPQTLANDLFATPFVASVRPKPLTSMCSAEAWE
jgi:hypothetical protein